MEIDRLTTLKTISVLTLVVLIVYLVFGTKWLLWVALLLTLGNTFENRFITAMAFYWMKFADVLGAFNSKIILTVTFYFILTPLALVYRIFNRPLVYHFRANKRQSYFEDLKKIYTPADFEKTW